MLLLYRLVNKHKKIIDVLNFLHVGNDFFSNDFSGHKYQVRLVSTEAGFGAWLLFLVVSFYVPIWRHGSRTMGSKICSILLLNSQWNFDGYQSYSSLLELYCISRCKTLAWICWGMFILLTCILFFLSNICIYLSKVV